MGRKPNPKPDDPEQSKRFAEMAREVEADGDKDSFDRSFKKVIAAPRKPSSQK
jgi:hypothetical protein